MKIALFVMLGFVTSVNAQVLNGSFEEWNSGVPDHWYLHGQGSRYGAIQSTDAHTGNYSVRFFAHFTSASPPPQQGLFILSTSSNVHGTPYGFRIPKGSNALSFWFHCGASSNINPGFGCLGHSVYSATIPSSSDWQKYTILFSPSNYSDSTLYDTIGMQFQAYLKYTNGMPDNSYDFELYIDDMTFDTVAASIYVKQNATYCDIIPNPISTMAAIRHNFQSDVVIHWALFDMMGKKLKIFPNIISTPNGVETFDVSELPSGIYVMRIDNGENVFMKKIIILH